MNSKIFVVVLLTAGALIAGCATKPPAPEPTTTGAELPASKPDVTVTANQMDGTGGARPPYEDPGSPLYNRTIYFDYDRSEIAQRYIPLLRTHAEYLGSHRETKVTLEGHTDERGTREYNLALGDQRAEAVRRFMAAEGVNTNQMAKLSFGEEKPADPGHGEPSWISNRRVQIAY